MPKKRPTQPDDSQPGLFQLVDVPNAYRKAVQVVHSKPTASLSLLQRKVSNAWLKHAVENDADPDGYWTIGISSMTSDIGYQSNNREYLRHSALGLMKIIFEWDQIAPEKKRSHWKASVLFPEIEILGDVIRFQISNQIRPQILRPDIFALIDLNIVRRFRRASSLAIYEHCFRFVNVGKTAHVPWEQFRDIALGESAEAKSYLAYKFFKAKCLKPAIAEINAESDILVELYETKVGRRVTTISFDVKRKADQLSPEPSDEFMLEAIGEMVRLGIPQSEAKRLVARNGADNVKAAVRYTRARMANKKQPPIDNPAAYFRQALASNWGQVADIEPKKSASGERLVASKPAAEIEAAYKLRQLDEAASYFKELDVADQTDLVSRYNEQQTTSALRINLQRPSKASLSAFYRWLANDTWGEPTADQLLALATEMLAERRASPDAR